MPQDLKTHYAIVGAGTAGITAAEAIREVDCKNELLVINGEKFSPYCRPLIIEVLKRERTFDDILLRKPGWFEDKNISIITGCPVVKIETREKSLTLASGRMIKWKKLLIASGARPVIPWIDGMEDVRMFTLFQQADVERVAPFCKAGARALMVGVGLIGLQAISALVQLGVEVVAVELQHKVLPLILDVKAAEYAKQKLEQNGIDVRTRTTLKKVWAADGSGHPYVALTGNGNKIRFDFLLISTGMRPDFVLINGSGIETERGIKVSSGMETSLTDIFAAGDITEYNDWTEGGSFIHGHWINAYRQGRIAGLRMAGKETVPYDPVNLNSLNIFGLPIITMGASRVDKPKNAKIYSSGVPKRSLYTRLVVKNDRLVAATFVNDVYRAGVFQYLMREKIDIGDIVESLLNNKLPGMNFLYKLHKKSIRGNVEWPASMDLIEFYQKDHSHTRWGKKKKQPKEKS